MIYGYCRCSTDKQTLEHQKFEVTKYAKANGMEINCWVEETISSRQPLKRRALGALLGKLRSNDILIACEISRLGRSLLEVMSILEKCLSRGCQVWTIKENYRLGNDIQSKVLAFAFGLAAEIERNLISQRTKASLANIRAKGMKLGRPLSEKTKQIRLLENIRKIRQFSQEGVTQAEMARRLEMSRSMLRRLLLQHNLIKVLPPRPHKPYKKRRPKPLLKLKLKIRSKKRKK